MLKRGFSRLIRLASSSSASASVWVVTISIDAVSDTMRRSRSGRRAELGVGGHPLLQVARLADIQRVALGIEHAVDARVAGMVASAASITAAPEGGAAGGGAAGGGGAGVRRLGVGPFRSSYQTDWRGRRMTYPSADRHSRRWWVVVQFERRLAIQSGALVSCSPTGRDWPEARRPGSGKRHA